MSLYRGPRELLPSRVAMFSYCYSSSPTHPLPTLYYRRALDLPLDEIPISLASIAIGLLASFGGG
jgi:hypothetical protein